MKRTKALKKIAFLAFLAAASAHSFDWPAKNMEQGQSPFTFSQNRAGAFNQSMVLKNAQIAKATDKGRIIAVITESQGDGDWFESPLGNAVIISHDDSLISIYGNLSKESADILLSKSGVQAGEELGSAADSAWSENGESGDLEFQIADTSSKTFINPIILMPRGLRAPRISTDGILMENQFGRMYSVSNIRSVPAGAYKLYKRRQNDITAHKSDIYVNGAEVDRITKEALKGQDGRLTLTGARGSYSSKDFYPSEDLEFLGNALLPHGSNTISISLSDIFENSATTNFNITGY